MACRNLVFMMPRANYGSAREVAEALAMALKQDGYRKRLRVMISTRDDEEARSGRVHWAFMIEKAEDAESRRQIAEALLERTVLPEISRIIHCGSCGEVWFEHRRQRERFRLGTVGVYLCGDVEKISFDYPQRGLTLPQLKEVEAAISETSLDAATIGQRLFYGTEVRQWEWRTYECWALHRGEAEPAPLDGERFIGGEGNYPAMMYALERKVEALRGGDGRLAWS